MGPPNDGEMEVEYEQPPHFCRSDLLEAVSLALTSIEAALFTAIVTAFVLDAMSDLDKMPQSNQQSSILTVNGLWFMSIMSSLAATTWAILCLEWCAFLTVGVQAEDYEEMAEKRQRKFEAMEGWKMRFIVATIPLFLHISLFLFLAGLWLRLRDINKQLGLIVGVSSLVIVSSYVVVTLLPIFTSAPFSTSASELIGPVVNGIRRLVQLRRFVRPPRVFASIGKLFPVGGSPRALLHIPYLDLEQVSAFAKDVYKVAGLYTHTTYKIVALLPVIPTLVFDRNPFDELNKLRVGNSKPDKRIHLRALFWLMNTPLSKDEVKEILKEFKNRGGGNEEPLDRTIIKLLVLSLSSILENGDISVDEQPIFDHCTTALAEGMDQAFESRGHNRRIIFRNTTDFGKLQDHFQLTSSSQEEINWPIRAIPALWLCPTEKTIKDVIHRLNFPSQLVKPSLLQKIIRGLHAAMLVSFDSNEPTDQIPDFSSSTWDWKYNKGLDKTLASFLQDVFAARFSTLSKIELPATTLSTELPTTTLSLVVECLNALNSHPNRCSLEFHTALCFLAVVMWRSDPQVSEEGPELARALLGFAGLFQKNDGDETYPDGVEILATRLRAVAYGPKPSITSRQSCSLKRLGELYDGLPESIKKDKRCLKSLLDAYAATLETTLAADGQYAIIGWLCSPDYAITQTLYENPLFDSELVFELMRDDPNYRLPYLYSLGIALTYTTEGRNQNVWKITRWFVNLDEKEKITIDRALDTNILVVAILRFAVSNQSDDEERGQMGAPIIDSLTNLIMHGTDWRTRWKSIYLAAGIASLLSQTNAEVPPSLVKLALQTFEKLERAPFDWGRMEEGLRLCQLESKIKSLIATRGGTGESVYDWSGGENVPYLALYNPRHTTPEPISHAAYWVMKKLQR